MIADSVRPYYLVYRNKIYIYYYYVYVIKYNLNLLSCY